MPVAIVNRAAKPNSERRAFITFNVLPHPAEPDRQ
jgi:hypothetical protein